MEVEKTEIWVVGTPNPAGGGNCGVRFEGRYNELEGAVYAPSGAVEILTLGSTLYGRFTGETVKVGGSENFLSDGTR